MTYQIYDTGAALKFSSTAGDLFIEKATVREIAIVRGDLVKISTGSCLCSHCFHRSDVTIPVSVNTVDLVEILNDWISNYVDTQER